MTAVEALVATPPQPGDARPYRFPEITREQPGGPVVAAHLPNQPLAVATLLLDAGAGREPADRAGVASVLAESLEEGTRRRDAAAYALALEGLGTGLATSVDWDSMRISVEVPVERLAEAVALLAEAVRTPLLEPADLERKRDDELTAARMRWANPGPRADAALRGALFTDRYARPPHGDPESIAVIGAQDVLDFHAAWLTRPGTLLVAGNLDRLDLSALGAAAFAGVTAADEPRPGPIAPPADVARRMLLVDRPGSVQSTLLLGHHAPPRADPDFVPMTLAGTVLGGAFSSRLNHLIREVRGYTYGIRAEFGQARRFGTFRVNTAVQTAVTGPALTDTVAEITRTRAEGVTEEELALARTWRAGQLSVDMQTPGAIAAALATLALHDLPDDYFVTLREQYLGATVPDVSAAAARHLNPEALTIVVEGDGATVRDGLTATGLGEVVDAG
ncbi:M16 family metallopeptidase [Rhizomonospora bruguierae]|uniref:M16 family metallopeptidase n=1 Tax=Rhizomonospora bruguierae TaxID=1581705 RepID=UPI001BCD626E|nr:pitrilysin family protein [Micromonospora sp. NBRC 107566]